MAGSTPPRSRSAPPICSARDGLPATAGHPQRPESAAWQPSSSAAANASAQHGMGIPWRSRILPLQPLRLPHVPRQRPLLPLCLPFQFVQTCARPRTLSHEHRQQIGQLGNAVEDPRALAYGSRASGDAPPPRFCRVCRRPSDSHPPPHADPLAPAWRAQTLCAAGTRGQDSNEVAKKVQDNIKNHPVQICGFRRPRAPRCALRACWPRCRFCAAWVRESNCIALAWNSRARTHAHSLEELLPLLQEYQGAPGFGTSAGVRDALARHRVSAPRCSKRLALLLTAPHWGCGDR